MPKMLWLKQYKPECFDDFSLNKTNHIVLFRVMVRSFSAEKRSLGRKALLDPGPRIEEHSAGACVCRRTLRAEPLPDAFQGVGTFTISDRSAMMNSIRAEPNPYG